MRTWDVTSLLDDREQQTAKTKAYAHAFDLELIFLDEMKKQGITKSELAERMGISLPRLSKLLNTQPNMTLETIAQFELALDIDLFFDVEENGLQIEFDANDSFGDFSLPATYKSAEKLFDASLGKNSLSLDKAAHDDLRKELRLAA